jgi:hypothetical protein
LSEWWQVSPQLEHEESEAKGAMKAEHTRASPWVVLRILNLTLGTLGVTEEHQHRSDTTL